MKVFFLVLVHILNFSYYNFNLIIFEFLAAILEKGLLINEPTRITESSSTLIDLFRLYILFSQYRSCDDTQEI